MTKDEKIRFIAKEFLAKNFEAFKSYNEYIKFSKINTKFWNSLSEKQKDLYLKCIDSFSVYSYLRDEEIISFALDLYNKI